MSAGLLGILGRWSIRYGAAKVTLDKVGASHNRNIPNASTTHPGTDTSNTATWTTAEAVTELKIRAISTPGDYIKNNEGYLIVLNAPTAALAKTYLEDAGAYNTDVLYMMAYPLEEFSVKATSNINRIDVLPLGSNMRFVISAV